MSEERRYPQDFDQEVIERLTRIETKHDTTIDRLDTINGRLNAHGIKLVEHDKALVKITTTASFLAAGVGAAASAAWHYIFGSQK